MARETREESWLGVEQLAAELDVPVRTIYSWRSKGTAPRGATFGRHVRFRRSDVDAWISGKYSDSPLESDEQPWAPDRRYRCSPPQR